MRMCDNNPAILQWANEAIHIPYRNPFTNRNTIYVPDFFVVFQDANGQNQAEMWEIKPSKETSLQEAGRSKHAQAHAILNACKWQAARAYCAAHQIKFRVITERELFHQGKR